MMLTTLSACMGPSSTIETGRVLYDANGCASCHGKAGHGDGPLQGRLPARAIDLGAVASYRLGTSEAVIAKTLREGISVDHPLPAQNKSHHELLMPKFDHLSETERRSIALYVISIQKGEIH